MTTKKPEVVIASAYDYLAAYVDGELVGTENSYEEIYRLALEAVSKKKWIDLSAAVQERICEEGRYPETLAALKKMK